jgi:hypothetical protein
MPRNITVTFDDGSTHVYQNAPDDVTPEMVTERAKREFSKPGRSLDGGRQADNSVGRGEALGKGFVRGVEQTLGGAAQKMAEIRLNQLNRQASELDAAMQSGEIPVNDEYLAEIDRIQSEAIKVAQGLKGFEQDETSKRQAYQPIQEQRPILSAIGNVGGQIAAVPIPAARLGLPGQMALGAAEGAALGAVQPTVGDETNAEEIQAGAIFGGAAPAVLRPIASAAGAAYRGLTGQASPDAARAIDYAREQNLPLMTSDVAPPETFAGRAAQSLAEKIPVVGTGGARAEQQAARSSQIKSVAEQYGLPSDEEIIKSLNKKSDKIAKAAGNRYTSIIDQMSGSVVEPRSTISVIDSQLSKLNVPGSIKNPKLTKILQTVKDDISSGSQDINLLRDNRTKFRETIKGESTVLNDTEQRVIDSVYKAMTDDIVNAVSKKLGPDAASRMRQADAVWSRESRAIKNTKLKNLFNKGDIKPEEASKMLFSNDKSEINTLFSALDTTGRQNARAAVIQRAFERSEGSPEKFLNEMKKMRNQTQAFFKGKEGRELNGLINYLQYTKEAGKAAVTTKTGQEAVQLGAPVAVMADVGTTGGLGTAGFAAYGALSRIYESPAVRDLMAKMAGIKPGSTAFEKLANQLEAELNKAATALPQAENKQ